MWISARDQARFGLLTPAARPVEGSADPFGKVDPDGGHADAAEPGYGFMNYFLNTGRKRFKAAPETAFAHQGAGTNTSTWTR